MVLLPIFLLGLAIPGHAAEVAETTVGKTALIDGISRFDFYLFTSILVTEAIILLSIVLCIRVLLKASKKVPEETPVAALKIRVPFWDRFHNLLPAEKEKDLMLDHDYDGIRELDNSLPPWWKYGFYLTIIIGFIYLWRFEVSGSGQNSYEEYISEMKQ